MRSPRLLPSLSALLCLFEASARAQAPGDWIYSDLSGGTVWRMDPSTGSYGALPGTGFGTGNGIAMAANNADIVIAMFSTTQQLVLQKPGGARSVISLVGGGAANGPTAVDLDQDGTYLVSEATGNGLYRVNPVSASASLLVTTGNYLNAVCIDQDTGDYVIGIWGAGLLQRVDRKTRQVTTIAGGLGSISGVDFEPRTGTYVVTTFTYPEVRRLTRTGQVTTVASSYNANAVRVDDETGDLVIAQGTVQPYNNSIGLYSASGALKRSFVTGNRTPTGIEIYGSRKVVGSGPATAGSIYNLALSFPRSPNAGYFLLLSTGLRSGIPLNDGTGRVVNVNASSLVFGDIPGITTGFLGSLSASGTAAATIALPSWFPAGVRLFVTAVAQNFALPSGFETANTWAFTTN